MLHITKNFSGRQPRRVFYDDHSNNHNPHLPIEEKKAEEKMEGRGVIRSVVMCSSDEEKMQRLHLDLTTAATYAPQPVAVSKTIYMLSRSFSSPEQAAELSKWFQEKGLSSVSSLIVSAVSEENLKKLSGSRVSPVRGILLGLALLGCGKEGLQQKGIFEALRQAVCYVFTQTRDGEIPPWVREKIKTEIEEKFQGLMFALGQLGYVWSDFSDVSDLLQNYICTSEFKNAVRLSSLMTSLVKLQCRWNPDLRIDCRGHLLQQLKKHALEFSAEDLCKVFSGLRMLGYVYSTSQEEVLPPNGLTPFCCSQLTTALVGKMPHFDREQIICVIKDLAKLGWQWRYLSAPCQKEMVLAIKRCVMGCDANQIKDLIWALSVLGCQWEDLVLEDCFVDVLKAVESSAPIPIGQPADAKREFPFAKESKRLQGTSERNVDHLLDNVHGLLDDLLNVVADDKSLPFTFNTANKFSTWAACHFELFCRLKDGRENKVGEEWQKKLSLFMEKIDKTLPIFIKRLPSIPHVNEITTDDPIMTAFTLQKFMDAVSYFCSLSSNQNQADSIEFEYDYKENGQEKTRKFIFDKRRETEVSETKENPASIEQELLNRLKSALPKECVVKNKCYIDGILSFPVEIVILLGRKVIFAIEKREPRKISKKDVFAFKFKEHIIKKFFDVSLVSKEFPKNDKKIKRFVSKIMKRVTPKIIELPLPSSSLQGSEAKETSAAKSLSDRPIETSNNDQSSCHKRKREEKESVHGSQAPIADQPPLKKQKCHTEPTPPTTTATGTFFSTRPGVKITVVPSEELVSYSRVKIPRA